MNDAPSRELPLLFADHPFSDHYRDLIEGRATIVGEQGLHLADGILAGGSRQWDAAAFAKAPRAKVISRIGVGYDNVDLPAAAAARITVCYTPRASLLSTAEHTVALMLAITKQLPRQMNRSREGRRAELRPRALELHGRVLGLVGLGRIGARVATISNALGMQVIASDPAVAHAPVAGVEIVNLDELFARADVVSLHAPLLPSTERMVNRSTLAAMRSGSYLVNCARGGLVDHEALLEAVDSGQLAGAALDVTDPEPLPSEHPLLHRDNVIVTPHAGALTVAGLRRLYEHSIDNALNVLVGLPADIVLGAP